MEPDASGARYGVSFDVRADASRFIVVRELSGERVLVAKGLIEWCDAVLVPSRDGGNKWQLSSAVRVALDQEHEVDVPQAVDRFVAHKWSVMRARLLGKKGN